LPARTNSGSVSSRAQHELVVSFRPRSSAPLAGGLAVASGVALALLNPSLGGGLAVFIILLFVAQRQLAYSWLLAVAIAPWGTLANAITQGRLVPLGLDLFLIVFVLTLLVQPRGTLARDAEVAVALVGSVTVQIVGAAEILNSRGLPIVDGMEGFRAFFLPLSGLAVGVFLGRRIESFGRDLAVAVVASVLIVAAMGIRQAIQPATIDLVIVQNSQSGLQPFLVTGTNRLRAFSPLPGPFHFGLLMLLGITVLAGDTFARRTHWRLAGLAFLVLALLLNATRLNWLGTAVALSVLLLSSLELASLHRWLVRLGSIALVALGSLWAFFQVESLEPIRRFAVSVIDPTTSTSFIYRVLGWRHDILPAIGRAPWVGYGTGMAKDGLGPLTSHNLFLKLLLEGGITLLVPYLVTITALTIALARRRAHPHARAGIALLAGVHAAGMFGPILDAFPGNLFFWLLLGTAVAVKPASEPALDQSSNPK
jgi:hypothetical protein